MSCALAAATTFDHFAIPLSNWGYRAKLLARFFIQETPGRWGHDNAAGHRSVNGVLAYKRGSEKLSQLTKSVLNRNEKKTKVEEGLKTEGHEDVQPAELVKPKGFCMQSLPTMPWNFGGTSQFTINFCGFSCWLCPHIIWILWVITGSVLSAESVCY